MRTILTDRHTHTHTHIETDKSMAIGEILQIILKITQICTYTHIHNYMHIIYIKTTMTRATGIDEI